MLYLIVFVLILTAIVAPLVIVCNYYDHKPKFYYDYKPNREIQIKFRDFKVYYALNPHRYELGAYYPSVLMDSDSYFDRVSICFGLVDFYRYRSMYRNKDKQRKINDKNQIIVHYLKMVMKDIDKVRKQSNSEIAEAAEYFKQIHI